MTDTPVPGRLVDTGTQYAGLTEVERAAAMVDPHMQACDAPTIDECQYCRNRLATIRELVAAVSPVIRRQERDRQAAYLYSIIQSAEESEDGGAESPVEVAYDNGIMYAARAVLDNWAQDTDWPEHAYEYAEEIRRRVVPGQDALPSLAPLIAETRAETAELIAAEIEDNVRNEDLSKQDRGGFYGVVPKMAYVAGHDRAAAIARSHSTPKDADHE